MNQKHREAFRELKSWCEKYDASIFVTQKEGLTFWMEGQNYFTALFDHESELMRQTSSTNHSISSEGEDE